ncbi:MAG: TonB family protein [Acidobacteriia bacterium]|nr:TonB family protein [Terriglobia bacterium]
MFTQVNTRVPRRQATLLGVSLALHFLALGWILHSPEPIFVAPQSIVKGVAGESLTRIYFGGRSGITQQQATNRVSWERRPKVEPLRTLPPLPARSQAGNQTTASARDAEVPGGSPYGSLSYGTVFNSEIRPALPVVSPDPAFDADVARGTSGDIIVEVTIDEVGNIVDRRVLQSLGPAIDERVLAALEKWHFLPATRNGVPMPSKQDVYYHFPR